MKSYLMKTLIVVIAFVGLLGSCGFTFRKRSDTSAGVKIKTGTKTKTSKVTTVRPIDIAPLEHAFSVVESAAKTGNYAAVIQATYFLIETADDYIDMTTPLITY